ncbi:MAG: aminoglycoside phosphotransferase/kinase family protein, partial [Nostoc sp.]
VLLTKNAQDHWRDVDGCFWRAISFIEGSQSFDRMRDRTQAKEIGYALGMFHNLISDLPPAKLADTLQGFHITPLYLQHYEKVLAKSRARQSLEVNYCLEFVSDHQSFAHILENAKAEGKLPLRLMHG